MMVEHVFLTITRGEMEPMTDMARLAVLLDEIGGYQQAIDAGMPLAVATPELLIRLREANELLPLGNQHIWNDFHMWIIYEWGSAYRSGGDAAGDPWLKFRADVQELLGPPVSD
ncbi:hypothetical protein NLX83_01795 [Allokutzneria sp. A3M-2-11 16]|uniref:hypothetical protein n=1 Tax=Allokutzneria sp. A3M-2-11 16 TaxID=2962043 RepID=UPI0020B7E482|nr:hypothetical protein [Allokutzneria sp. A3M-2-11 16]MCP3797982.1 hypothetical protein [Allokutzneria sp. A3M-2-11 16]